jgi:hypothetical protein
MNYVQAAAAATSLCAGGGGQRGGRKREREKVRKYFRNECMRRQSLKANSNAAADRWGKKES